MAEEQCGTYNVVIKTNDHKADASTKSDVYLQFVGKDKTVTDWEKLTSFWRRRFRQGNIDSFQLTMKDVGIPLLIRLKIEPNGIDAGWGCDYVIVTYHDETEEFPIYDWVTDSIEAVSGQAVLLQNVDEELVWTSRECEKSRNKQLYRWADKERLAKLNWKLPRQLDAKGYMDLPAVFKYDQRFSEIGNNKKRFNEFKWNAMLQKIKGAFFGIESFEDYNHLHEKLESRFLPFHERWMDDEEFGRHMLDGSSKSIKRCRGLPAYCKVKHHHVSEFLNETLDEEIVKGRIYIADPGAFSQHVARNKIGDMQLYCPDATAIFYSTKNKFLPIAIQLEPNYGDSIFTPKDEKYDWLLAKMFFKCAEFNYHEHGQHFITHVVMGSVAVALFRCLPRSHPVHKLLRPHLNLIIAANQRGTDFLYVQKTVKRFRAQDTSDHTMESYKDFMFEDVYFPQKMQRRGLMDTDVLPNYHFRDDALLYWEAIDKFIGKIVNRYYESDNDIKNDGELQSWIGEIVEEGYLYDPSMKTTCPKCFKSKEDLQLFATAVIFTVSVYHASVHFPQYEMYKFIPNTPAGMRMPIHKKGEGSLERILATLPDLDMSLAQIGVSYMATALDENDVLLGQYPDRHFTEPDTIAILGEFSNDIKEIGNIIKQRNAEREHQYEYLLPENIPATINQ